MKNYHEMADDIFRRRDEYVVEQKQKRKTALRAAASFCCVCLTALVGFGVLSRGTASTTPTHTSSAEMIDDAIYPGVKDTFDESKGESPDQPEKNNRIVINSITSISEGKHDIALMRDDFVAMDKVAINEYYGINIFPTVPADLTEWEDSAYGIFKRNGGTGEVYWDSSVLNYSNEDFSRSVNIEIDKNGLPFSCCVILELREDEKSIINNTEVAIALSDAGYYYAEFMHQNTGFRIIGEGLSEKEMVSVISSLIKS